MEFAVPLNVFLTVSTAVFALATVVALADVTRIMYVAGKLRLSKGHVLKRKHDPVSCLKERPLPVLKVCVLVLAAAVDTSKVIYDSAVSVGIAPKGAVIDAIRIFQNPGVPRIFVNLIDYSITATLFSQEDGDPYSAVRDVLDGVESGTEGLRSSIGVSANHSTGLWFCSQGAYRPLVFAYEGLPLLEISSEGTFECASLPAWYGISRQIAGDGVTSAFSEEQPLTAVHSCTPGRFRGGGNGGVRIRRISSYHAPFINGCPEGSPSPIKLTSVEGSNVTYVLSIEGELSMYVDITGPSFEDGFEIYRADTVRVTPTESDGWARAVQISVSCLMMPDKSSGRCYTVDPSTDTVTIIWVNGYDNTAWEQLVGNTVIDEEYGLGSLRIDSFDRLAIDVAVWALGDLDIEIVKVASEVATVRLETWAFLAFAPHLIVLLLVLLTYSTIVRNIPDYPTTPWEGYSLAWAENVPDRAPLRRRRSEPGLRLRVVEGKLAAGVDAGREVLDVDRQDGPDSRNSSGKPLPHLEDDVDTPQSTTCTPGSVNCPDTAAGRRRAGSRDGPSNGPASFRILIAAALLLCGHGLVIDLAGDRIRHATTRAGSRKRSEGLLGGAGAQRRGNLVSRVCTGCVANRTECSSTDTNRGLELEVDNGALYYVSCAGLSNITSTLRGTRCFPSTGVSLPFGGTAVLCKGDIEMATGGFSCVGGEALAVKCINGCTLNSMGNEVYAPEAEIMVKEGALSIGPGGSAMVLPDREIPVRSGAGTSFSCYASNGSLLPRRCCTGDRMYVDRERSGVVQAHDNNFLYHTLFILTVLLLSDMV